MAAGTVGNTAFTQVSPMDDPTFANLFQQIMASIPGSLQGIESIVSGGMNSPLLQLVLGPALERLKAPQAQQREQFTESARAAGGLRGSTYGGGMNKLMQNQGQAQNDLMSQIIQQVLGTLVGGQLRSQEQQFLPAQTMGNLLPRIAPQTIQGSMGGGGGGSYGGGGSSGRSSILQPGIDFGNYTAGNAITQPGVGAPMGGGGFDPMAGGRAQAPQYAPPQYVDPWAGFGGYATGGGGGGSYDIGGGQQWLGGPSQDQFGYTENDWMADPFYSDTGWDF